jgi:hypothetical protein
LTPLRGSRPNLRGRLTLTENRGDIGTGVYMREGITSRVMAADRPYGEF